MRLLCGGLWGGYIFKTLFGSEMYAINKKFLVAELLLSPAVADFL